MNQPLLLFGLRVSLVVGALLACGAWSTGAQEPAAEPSAQPAVDAPAVDSPPNEDAPADEPSADEPSAVEPPADEAEQPAGPSADEVVARGKYLVHHVAMCIYCHSPKTSDGGINRNQLLRGGTVPVSSPFAGQRWALHAPRLAGLPSGWSEAELVHFLQTTELRGQAAQAPMPPFRMSKADAQAVAAYLKSLP